MLDKLYYWLRYTMNSRFDYKLPKDLQPKDKDRFAKVDPANPAAGKVTPEEKEDRKDGIVEIPVGGIDPVSGTIYEQVVRPDGKEPIYKEVNIDNTTPPPGSETEEKPEIEEKRTTDE